MLCGNKAESLESLKSQGMNVPKYVATDKKFFIDMLKECKVYEDAQMVVVKSAWIKDIFEEIHTKIINTSLSSEFIESVYNFTEELKFPVSVRSSASVEDAKNSSCAGLFYTALCVEKEQLVNEIKNVIASLYSNKCLISIDKQDFHPDNYYMGVVIQEMVDSEWSGVVFSENPVTNNNNEIIIEMIEGLGEKLVSGESKSMQLVVDKATKEIQNKDNIERVPIELIEQLINDVCKLEGILGYPVDVEWAINGKELFLLQCRPIVKAGDIVDIETYKFFPMRELGANYQYLDVLKDRYTKWHKKELFFKFAYEEKIKTNNWNLLAFRSNSLDKIDFSQLLAEYESDYVIYHLSNQYVSSCRKEKLKDIIKEYVGENNKNYYCVSIRESIPNVLSAISYLNLDGNIQIEVVFGKMGVLNNGIVAPTLYIVDSKDNIIVKKERKQNKYIFSDEKVEAQKTSEEGVAFLLDVVIRDIAIKTRIYEKKFGICSVEWWIWNSQAYAADISVLNKAIDTKEGRVISTGQVEGYLRAFPKLEAKTMNDLNMFSAISVSDTEFDVNKVDAFKELSEYITKWREEGPIILYSELPYIYLTPFVKMVDGFVFEEASSLCHLSLIIREAGVPAISLMGDKIRQNVDTKMVLNAIEGVIEK